MCVYESNRSEFESKFERRRLTRNFAKKFANKHHQISVKSILYGRFFFIYFLIVIVVISEKCFGSDINLFSLGC